MVNVKASAIKLFNFALSRRFSSGNNYKNKNEWKWNSNFLKDCQNKKHFGPVRGKKTLLEKTKSPSNEDESEISGVDKQGEEHWIGMIGGPEKIRPIKPLQTSLDRAIFSAVSTLPRKTAFEFPFEEDIPSQRFETCDRTSTRAFPLLNKTKQDSGVIVTEGTIQYGFHSTKKENLPSVTKILKETMPEKSRISLKLWEEKMIQEMGHEKFLEMQQLTLNRGKKLHEILKIYFETGSLKCDRNDDWVTKKHLESLRPVMEKFERPALVLESHVSHDELQYHGYLDCITRFATSSEEKRVVLIDWKTSTKPKLTLGSTFDTPLQIAAYVGALNADTRYPFQVTNAMAVIVYNDGAEASLLKMGRKALEKYWSVWLKRLQEYRCAYPTSNT